MFYSQRSTLVLLVVAQEAYSIVVKSFICINFQRAPKARSLQREECRAAEMAHNSTEQDSGERDNKRLGELAGRGVEREKMAAYLC